MNGSGCHACPAREQCNAQMYRGLACLAIRESVGLGDPRTNADRIRAMTDEELAEMISGIHYDWENPWRTQFARKFCDNCPAPEYTLEDGRKMKLHECDFSDGKCPHGDSVVWWLQQPAEEVQGDGR